MKKPIDDINADKLLEDLDRDMSFYDDDFSIDYIINRGKPNVPRKR